MSELHFTKTEQRIIAILADGEPHARKELIVCLNDELASFGALKVHLSNIRKKLKTQGEDIVFVASYKCWGYRQVRFLNHKE